MTATRKPARFSLNTSPTNGRTGPQAAAQAALQILRRLLVPQRPAMTTGTPTEPCSSILWGKTGAMAGTALYPSRFNNYLLLPTIFDCDFLNRVSRRGSTSKLVSCGTPKEIFGTKLESIGYQDGSSSEPYVPPALAACILLIISVSSSGEIWAYSVPFGVSLTTEYPPSPLFLRYGSPRKRLVTSRIGWSLMAGAPVVFNHRLPLDCLKPSNKLSTLVEYVIIYFPRLFALEMVFVSASQDSLVRLVQTCQLQCPLLLLLHHAGNLDSEQQNPQMI